MKCGVSLKIALETSGSPLKVLACTVTMENPLPIFIERMVFSVVRYSASMKIEKDGFGVAVIWDSFAMMGNPFSLLQRMDLGGDLSTVLSACPETIRSDTLIISRHRPVAT